MEIRRATMAGWAARMLVVATAMTAAGAMIAPPANLGDMAITSSSVVLARAADSRNDEGPYIPHTVTRFLTIEIVTGEDPGGEFFVSEPGGEVDGMAAAVPGAPRFQAGAEYLLFLAPAEDGLWRVRMMAYGVFERVEAGGEAFFVPVPERGQVALAPRFPVEVPGVYRARPLLETLAAVARGAAPWDSGDLLAPPHVVRSLSPEAAPPACRFMEYSDGYGVRWFSFDSGGHATVSATTPGQEGIADGGTGAVSAGAGAWTGDPASSIDLRYGGQTSRSISCTSGGTDYQSGAVVFNDPCGDLTPLSNCSGTLAYGGPLFYVSTETFDGTPWHPATALFVVVNDGAQCIGETDFAEMITHELGHGLGFGHHTDPEATMYSQCCHYPRGAGLGATDSACAAYLYPDQATPQPPAAPTGLIATAVSSNRVDLSWTDTSADEDGFRIYRSTGGGFFQVGAVGPGTTAWSDTSPGPCASVQYRVTAYNSAGESAPSNVASAETPGAPPQAPSAVVAQARDSHTVTVSWSNGAVSQDTVEVQRASGLGSFLVLATLPGTAASFTDTGVQPGTTYRYKLRALNGCGSSPDSPVASVLVPPQEEPLAVTFQWDPATPWIGSPVRFAAQASKAGATFQWDLGDGTTASGASVNHLYPRAGEYSVQVTATLGDETATAESRISVSETPPLRRPRRVQRVFAVHSR